MFLTSNKIEYCWRFHKLIKVFNKNYLSWYLCELNRSIFLLDFVSLNPYWGFQVSTFWLRLSRLRWWSRLQNLNGRVSLESANDIPNIVMKFLLPFCSCNKTWITDVLNVKQTWHKVLPSTTLCATPPTLQISIPRHTYFTIWWHVSFLQAMVTKRTVT